MPASTYHATNDTMMLPEAVEEGLNDYIGSPTVNQIILEYGGNKSALAQELAGTTDKSSTAYQTQMKNINRWLNYEAGMRGKQARNIQRYSATVERMQNVMRGRVQPQGMDISISGLICISNDCRERNIEINSNDYPINVGSMLDHVRNGDTTSAYADIFSNYARGMMVIDASDVSIDFW